MKMSYLAVPFVLLAANISFAQNHNTLWCDKDMKNKNTHHVTALKSEKGSWNLEVSWGGANGGSTFAPANLSITNGTCEACKPLGAIGTNHAKEVWKVKVTDASKPVTLAWATAGTINMCGKGTVVLRQ